MCLARRQEKDAMMRSRLTSALSLLLICGCTERPPLQGEDTGTTKSEASSPETVNDTDPRLPPTQPPLPQRSPPLEQTQPLPPEDPAPPTLEPQDPNSHMSSWRGNGHNRWDSAPPTITWGPQENVIWSTELPNWGNSSPVVHGDHVYVTIEPTTVVAMNRTTGQILWKRTNDYLDTLSGTDRKRAKANKAHVQRLEEQIVKDQRQVNGLRRDLRRANAPDDIEKTLEKLNQRLDSAQKKARSLRRAETPNRRDIIGYASATLVASDRGVYGIFGNGVVSRFNHNGERKWSRWLGEPAPSMRGYEWGHATSPLLIKDVLIAGFGKLHGLDALTGEPRWIGPEWREFGNLAVATVGGNPVVISPMGTIIRPRDGHVLSRDLPSLIYLGATAEKDRVYMSGNPAQNGKKDLPRIANAFRLLPDGPNRVKVQELWKHEALADRYYAQPLVWDDRLWIVDKDCMLTTRSLKTGEKLETLRISPEGPRPPCYSAPAAAGKFVFLSISNGYTAIIPAGSTQIQRVNFLEEGRANLLFDKDRIFIRTLNRLFAIGVPG